MFDAPEQARSAGMNSLLQNLRVPRFLVRLLGITDREAGRLFAMGLLFFLVMAGLGFGRAANESFFIESAGADSVPLMYIVNAALMAVMAGVYSVLQERVSRYRLLVYQLIFFAASLALLHWRIRAYPSGETPAWMAFAIFGYYELFLLALVVHFWTYANDVFDPREGKRAFPIVGGAGILGNILGSLLAGPLVRYTGATEHLFLVWSALTALSLPVAFLVRSAALAVGVTAGSADASLREEGFADLRELWANPLVRRLALIQLPLWLTVHTVDWLFLIAAESMYPVADERTAFLGWLNGLVSLTGLALQFFVTGRILRKVGVAPAFATYAFSMTFGAIALLVRSLLPPAGRALEALQPQRLLAMTARFVDESVLYSIHESATQLLYNAIPGELRGLARAVINGAVEPAVTALAGLLLLGLATLKTPDSLVAGGAIVCGFVWIALSVGVKRDYLHALFDNLNSRDLDRRNFALENLSGASDAETNRLLVTAALSQDSESALYSLSLLENSATDQDLAILTSALLDRPAEVQAEALRLLGDRAYAPAAELALRLFRSPYAETRAMAGRAYGRMAGARGRKKLTALLKDPAPVVRGAAITALLADATRISKSSAPYRALVQLTRSAAGAARQVAARTIRELGRIEFADLLSDLARSKSLEVQYEAVKTMGALGDARLTPHLVQRFKDDQLTHLAQDALVRMGPSAAPYLIQELKRSDLDEATLTAILKTLGEIGGPESVVILGRYIVQHELVVEDAAIHALSRIKERLEQTGDVDAAASAFPPDLRENLQRACASMLRKVQRDNNFVLKLRAERKERGATLLVDALERTSVHRLDVALKFLEILEDGAAVRAAAASIRGGERRAVAEGVELLEGAGEFSAELARLLEARENGRKTSEEDLELYEILIDLMVQKQEPWFMACVIFAIGELHVRELGDYLQGLMTHPAQLVRNNAAIAAKKLGLRGGRKVDSAEVKKMNRDMERILFLRSVPIFSDVDGSDLQWINEIAHERKVRAGYVVFRENDVGDAMYIVLKGRVRVLKGANLVLQIMEDKDCFGEMSILDREPRSATVETVVETTLLAIKRDDFQRLLLARPQIAFALFKTISRRLREATERLSARS